MFRKRSTKYKIYLVAKILLAIAFIIYAGTPEALMDMFKTLKDAIESTIQNNH